MKEKIQLRAQRSRSQLEGRERASFSAQAETKLSGLCDNALPPDKREGTAALTGLEYCNKLFAWEEQFKGLSPEERTKLHIPE